FLLPLTPERGESSVCSSFYAVASPPPSTDRGSRWGGSAASSFHTRGWVSRRQSALVQSGISNSASPSTEGSEWVNDDLTQQAPVMMELPRRNPLPHSDMDKLRSVNTPSTNLLVEDSSSHAEPEGYPGGG
ncbi:unnamed protein product, partial [Discosporangium mesarthrocarpum]